ncbi:hypothetical protein PG996_004746 [Apiospora saccharicola]|uniref:Uncharacterized protein n=1 Tax=Apiospora saccharicola TaxID=335842 RepID=A0ABR1W7P4_9PEZI
MLYSRIILFLSMALTAAAAPIAEGDGPTTQDCKRETGDDRDADIPVWQKQQCPFFFTERVMGQVWLG